VNPFGTSGQEVPNQMAVGADAGFQLGKLVSGSDADKKKKKAVDHAEQRIKETFNLSGSSD